MEEADEEVEEADEVVEEAAEVEELPPPWGDESSEPPEGGPPEAEEVLPETKEGLPSLPPAGVRIAHMSKFLALRLAYGTATAKEIAACTQGGSSASGLQR